MKINPVYGKEVKLRVRSLKFAMTILFFNLGLIAIALLGFEVFFNVNMNYRIDYSGATQVYFIIICLEAALMTVSRSAAPASAAAAAFFAAASTASRMVRSPKAHLPRFWMPAAKAVR